MKSKFILFFFLEILGKNLTVLFCPDQKMSRYLAIKTKGLEKGPFKKCVTQEVIFFLLTQDNQQLKDNNMVSFLHLIFYKSSFLPTYLYYFLKKFN